MISTFKQQIIVAVLFFSFAAVMLGYELGVGVSQGWRFNGLLIIAGCCFLYGYRLLQDVLKQKTLITLNS